jgi:integrase
MPVGIAYLDLPVDLPVGGALGRELEERVRRGLVSLLSNGYLTVVERVQAVIMQAPHAQARLLMLTQWRAGLRVSEALALEVADLDFGGSNPTARVRRGKGNKPRLVPIHPELAAGQRNYLDYSSTRKGRI